MSDKKYLDRIGPDFGRKVRRMIQRDRRAGEVRTVETPLSLEQEQQMAHDRAQAVEQRSQKEEK